MKRLFSVQRLYMHLQKNRELSEQKLQVGGEYYPLEDGQFQLYGQGLVVHVMNGAPDIPAGSFVQVEFEAEASSFDQQNIELSRVNSIETLTERESYSGFKSALQARQWGDFISKVETCLEDLGLLKVSTPNLVVNPGMEVELNSFKTSWQFGSKQQDFYLPTSPELHLKQLLCKGLTDIYEIKTCFRNDELSEYHEPEFQMLEWYRAYADLDQIESDLKNLVQVFKPETTFIKKTMAELFREYVGFELTSQTTREELYELAKSKALSVSNSESWNDIFHFIYVQLIEPHLSQYEALILKDYPPSQCALAKLTSEGWADRMELYLEGVEIANAFNELTSMQDQRARFEEQQQERKSLGKEVLPIDENFLRALEAGMPPAGGIALGLDRLFMNVYGVKRIQDTRVFSMNSELMGFTQS